MAATGPQCSPKRFEAKHSFAPQNYVLRMTKGHVNAKKKFKKGKMFETKK